MNSPVSCIALLQLAAAEEQQNLAKAEEYFDLAVSEARREPDQSNLPLVCSRFSAFLRRQGRDNEALLLFVGTTGEMPKVGRFEALRLNRAKEAILQMKRDGAFIDESDALHKLADYGWLRTNGMDFMSAILMSKVGIAACHMVFQETLSVAQLASDDDAI